MQRLSTITPFTVFMELCPFVKCDHPSVNLLFESLTQRPFEILSQNLAQKKSSIRRCARNKYCNSTYILMELCPFVNFSMCPLNNSETRGGIFLKLGTNIKGHQMMCRDRLHNSTYSFHVIMPPW